MPDALLCLDPGAGPVVRVALRDVVAGALPGWRLRAPAARGSALARTVRRADAVVLAGGTLGSDLGAGARAGVLAARVNDRPVALVDVGAPAGATRAVRRRATGLVRAADLLVVRGRWTAARLAAAGAPAPFRVGAPLLWAADGAATDGAATAPPPEALLVAVRAPAPAARLAQALRGASARTGLPVRLAQWRTRRGLGRDAALARDVAARLPHAEVLAPAADLDDARAQAADAGAVLAASTADAIVAATAGARFAVETADPDLAAIALLARQPVIGTEADPAALAATLEETVDGAPPAPDARAAQAGAAQGALGLLRLVCERGRATEALAAPSLPLEPPPEVVA